MLAVPIGLQLGDGLGLGDTLGLGLGDGLTLGEGLGDGLGPWATDTVAPTVRKIAPMATTAHWTQRGCPTRRVCEVRLECAAWFKMVVIIFLPVSCLLMWT
jgi:hypothetical protein